MKGKKRPLWSVREVEESVIRIVKQHARRNGFTIAGALKDLVTKKGD